MVPDTVEREIMVLDDEVRYRECLGQLRQSLVPNLHPIVFTQKKVVKILPPEIENNKRNGSEIENKIANLPGSILEIIFNDSYISFLWNENLGIDELEKIEKQLKKN